MFDEDNGKYNASLFLQILGITLVSFFIVLFYILNNVDSPQSKQISIIPIWHHETKKQSNVWPSRLVIPSINVDTTIENVGVTSQGIMGVPNNATNVGWFDLGTRPGEKGSAVIAGHFDKQNGDAGIFVNLSKLKVGNKLYVKNSDGKSITFVVRESRIYNPGYADEIFSKNDKAHLNLITCDGVWDESKKSYNKRLVVFADLYNKP